MSGARFESGARHGDGRRGVGCGELAALPYDALTHGPDGARLDVGVVPTRRRAIPLPPGITDLVTAHRATGDADAACAGADRLFVNGDGHPLDQRRVRSTMVRVLAAAGVPRSDGPWYRRFRATFALGAARAGVTPEDLASLLGHRRVDVVRPYFDPAAVAAVGDLAGVLGVASTLRRWSDAVIR
jgi:hypothetical protein